MEYEARWITTKRKAETPAFKSLIHPEKGYYFTIKKQLKGYSLYHCAVCRKVASIRKNKEQHCPVLSSIKVNNVTRNFLQNPDELPHICINDPETNGEDNWSSIIIRDHYNDTIAVIQQTASELGNRIIGPTAAQKLLESRVRGENPQITHLAPSFKKTKNTFNKAVKGYRIEVRDPRAIPLPLALLGFPRPIGISAPGREALEDFFLLFEERRPNHSPFLIFSCLTGIKLLHQKQYFSCDGTFAYYPQEFSQIYSIQAIHHEYLPQRAEASLITFALLPGKEEAVYYRLFDSLNTKVHEEFGDLGPEKCFIFDHEIGAQNACRNIYNRPGDRVLSCYFHWSQNLIKKANNCGLKPYFNEMNVRRFFLEIQGTVFLPMDISCLILQHIMENRPFSFDNHHFNEAINRFALYMDYWLQENNLRAVNQFEEDAARTTNFSEAWNSTLKSIFTMTHPPLGHFISQMREELLRHQTQGLLLIHGIELPKQREPHNVVAEQRVRAAKQQIKTYMAQIGPANDGNIHLDPELMLHYCRHQARNCATQLPVLNLSEAQNGANDDSILVLNLEIENDENLEFSF